MKKAAIVLAASIVSAVCLQSTAWSSSSLLMQLPAILAKPQGGTTTVNDNVTVIDENSAAEILGSNTNATGDTELQLSGELANSAQNGSILYLLSGADDRFPFGIAGKVVSAASNADGTKTVILGEASYADVVQEASFNMDNIVLDASNFVGVIAPAAVEAASPMPPMLAKSAADGSVYSFRNGAVVVRKAAGTDGMMYSAAEGSTIDAGTVSLNMKVGLSGMGVDVSNLTNVNGFLGFVISGSLDHIKVTNDYDFSIFPPELEVNLHVESDMNFDVKFKGEGRANFGYLSPAWKEVEESMFNKLGINAKLTGLDRKDKIGKYPLAGLVWAIQCPPQGCPVVMGADKIAIGQGKAMGGILWIYLNIEGGFSIDGELTIAKLHPASLSLGFKKTRGGDFQKIQSLRKINSSGRLLEAPKFKGSADFQAKAGISTEVDFIASGVRIVNAGLDTLAHIRMGITGEASYGTDSLDSPWNWEAQTCFTTNIGAGAIGRLSANFGIKLDTKWGKIEGEPGFEYRGQWPTDDEMNSPGRHYAWYNRVGEEICTNKTVTSATGRVWMDRNLGASRVATSITDEQAYGDLYQWGRKKDGHEKRTSGTTTTLSSTDDPGHGNFIKTSSEPYDWRNPSSSNLWQGSNGINNPCPVGFRVPTANEWQEEMNSWNSKDAASAFASPLKWSQAGFRYHADGIINYDGAGYWTSSVSGGGIASFASIDNDKAFTFCGINANGMSVRCIKDDDAQVLTVTSATGRVWMDRNLGASRVATSMTDTQAYGDLYQWGRKKDGHEKRTSGTATTLSSTDDPGHGNFIKTSSEPYDWRSSQNDNLWQGVSGINNPCPAGFRVPIADEWQEEIDSWNSSGSAGAFASALKITLAGERNFSTGALNDVNDWGCYWTSTVNGFRDESHSMSVVGSNAWLNNSWYRGAGCSVRCIKD